MHFINWASDQFLCYFLTLWEHEVKAHTASVCLKQCKQHYFPTKFLIVLLRFCSNLCSLLWDWRRHLLLGKLWEKWVVLLQAAWLRNYGGSWDQNASILEYLSQLQNHNLCNWRQQPFKHHAGFTFPLPICGGDFLAIMVCSPRMCNDCYNRKVIKWLGRYHGFLWIEDKMIKLAEVTNWVV